jgi:hypothetical protein
MDRLPKNCPIVFQGKVVIRKRELEVYVTSEETEKILKQIFELLKTPYNADEEQLIDIHCDVNGKNVSIYKLGFAIASEYGNNDILLALYIKRTDGTTRDKNPYTVIKLNKNTFSDTEKNSLKNFIEKGIYSLIVEKVCRNLIEGPIKHRTN